MLLPVFVWPNSAVNPDNKRVSMVLGAEPTLFHARATDSESMFVLGHIMEGLLQFGKGNSLLPGVATRWELNHSGAKFWLRDNAKWQDGQPVTAHDFVFAWQTMLNPETAAQYASMLYPIKNARAIHQGKMQALTLGVVALDDYTLEVYFNEPCPYFLNLMPFVSFLPLRKDVYEAHKHSYGSEVPLLMTNGAFKLTEWVHGASLSLDRADNYWAVDLIKLAGIDIPYITADSSARINLFRNKQVAYTRLDSSAYSQVLASGLQMRSFSDGFLHYLEFNHRKGKATANKFLRQAVALVLDTREIANKVLPSPSVKPLYSQFPSTVKAGNQRLQNVYPMPKSLPNLTKARELFTLAKQQLGAVPVITLLVSDNPNAIKLGEYIQFVLSYGLGLQVNLDKQIFKQRLAKSLAGDFDIVLTNWGPDFDDALTFADLFASWNINNRGRYNSRQYDALITLLQQYVDVDKRTKVMQDLRTHLISESVIVPLYESGSIYLQHDQLDKVYRSAFGGDPILRFAEIIVP